MPSNNKPQIHLIIAPELPSNLVSKPHIVDTIKRYFNSDTEIVLLEGESGSGRTTLLCEFIETVNDQCFGVFLSPGNRASYGTSLISQSLILQLHSYLTGTSPSESKLFRSELHSLWQKCNKKLKRIGRYAYVIIDGLHHIDPQESAIREAIWELMPHHHAQIKILCSVDLNSTALPSMDRVKAKPYPVNNFAPFESCEYLGDVIPDKKRIEKFHEKYGGHPASLASLRRQVRFLNEKYDDPILDFPTDTKELLRKEWTISKPKSPEIVKAIATLIADGRPLSHTTLAKYCGLSEKNISEELRHLPFLKYSNNNATWEFHCNGIREIVQSSIVSEVKHARELIAESYLTNPDSSESLSQLPQYLEDATQSENLLSWLTEDRIIKILREDETAADLESTLRKAITVYKNAQQYEGLLAYSLSSSTIKYLTNSENLNDEIGARAALGDFDGAMKLVNSVPLLTRRLRLMAVVLNAFSDEDGVRLDTLRSEFEAILRQFDWSSLPNDEAISIAEDIYPVDPAWGLDILNKVVGADGGEGALDLALARISLSAIQSKASDQLSRKSDDQDPIPDYRLIDNKLRQFLDAVGRVLEAKSASDILSAVTTIQEPSQKLFLLRKWSLQNSFKKDAILITERAINLSIESIPSVLTADFFREITTALPYCEEYETIEEIIKILDGQDHIIKKRGPTVEYVRLHLQIVKSDWNRGNIERAINRMDQLYCGTIDKLAESSSTQLSCLAWFISIVSTLKGVPEIDDCDTWVEISEERYNSCRNEILLNSADQLEIVQGALQALAVNVPHKACDLSSRLNTEDRQMIGYRVILDTICRSPITSPKFDTTSNILTILIATEYYDSAILQITLRLCSDVEDKKQTISEVKWIFDFFDHCNSAIIRIKCMASLLAVVTNESGCRPIKEQLEREIISTFNGIISETDKYNAACILLAKLKGKVDECELAVSHVLTFLRELKGDRPLDRVTYKGLYWILDLLAKSVRGLAESGGLNERDVERVCSLIHSVNNESLKLTLNASIAIYLWNVGLNDMYANIVNNRLWPTLNALSSGDLSTKYKMWAKVYPALWLQNRDRARNGIEEFPDWVRERCNTSLCYTILRRQPLADPFDDQARNRRISRSYDDVSNLLQVCSESNSDDLIASIYTWIADELTGKNPKQKLTEEQMAEVARKMYDLADRKLPITSGIKHDGYRILCQAQALRISKIDDCSWGRLTDEAKNLDNHADRIFVLAHLGMEYKKKKEGIKLLHEVEKDCGELLTYEDRLNRYYAIASIVVDWDKKLARTIIKKAYEEVAGIGVKNIGIKERDLIDLAYRIDPALPMELAVVYDQDSVRREYYENRAQQELKTLEVKGNIVNNKISQKDKENEQNEKVFASAVRRALQSLNSGMLAKVDSERCREMIQRASESPLDTAYPIYSWALASLALSHSGKGARQNYLRDAFEGVLRGAKLYCSLTEVTGSYLEPPDWEDLSMKNDPLIVGIGQRQKAVDFIQRWIRERAEDFLIIADPYFDDTHLEILMHVLKSDHQMTVFVVTGGKKKEDLNYQNLRNAWKKICEQEPPITEITIVYVADDPRKRAPFHDRWLLSNGVGLNLGTSYNSLGNSDSTIRQMSDTELRTISERIEPYRKGKTMIDGKKLVYNKFELAH